MNTIFGIHVGNSSACLAVCKFDESKAFHIEVIANNAGERVMPAIVTIMENEAVVGSACKSLMTTRWNATITYNKRKMDRNILDVMTNGERKVAQTIRDDELHYSIPFQDRTEVWTTVEIARCIYRSLYDIATSVIPNRGEENEISCVLMVPKHFSEKTRFKVRSAAEAGGWDVMHLVNEPAVAVLGYNLLDGRTPPPRQTVLVYRVGGKTCDATVIDLNHGLTTILETEYSEDIGGKFLVNTFTQYLADEFYRRYRLEPRESHRSSSKLIVAAEECMHVLSTSEHANCFIESLCEGVDLNYNMSRARFESLLFPHLPKFSKPLEDVLAKLKMTPGNISTVLLCGGPLKIPRLKKYITDIFQETNARIMPLPNGINYDEVLACGAARQAGLLRLDETDSYLSGEIDIPVLEYSLTVEVTGAECDAIEFESDHPLPAHRTIKLNSPQQLVTLIFSQQESEQSFLRGQVQLEDLEDPTELELEIDKENGIKLGIPEAPGVFRHQIVRMYATE